MARHAGARRDDGGPLHVPSTLDLGKRGALQQEPRSAVR